MKITSKRGRAKTEKGWPFPTGRQVDSTPAPEELTDEEFEDAEVIRRTTKGVDIYLDLDDLQEEGDVEIIIVQEDDEFVEIIDT